jgi:hypothetical protein
VPKVAISATKQINKESKHMKLKKGDLKSKSGLKFSQQMIVISLLVATIIIVLIMNWLSSTALRDTVDIVVLRSSVPKDGIITQANLERRTMVRAEFEKFGFITLANGSRLRSVATWEDRGSILNTFAAYFLREGTPIYWDSLTREAPRRNSYLYQMDGELLRLDISAGIFGELIVPGDRLNIRVTYTERDFRLPTEEEYYSRSMNAFGGFNFGGMQQVGTIERQEMLFNEVRVLDMLNGQGESVFDIYYNLISLPRNQQLAMIESDEFKQRVKPTTILLAVTTEEADRYMHIMSKSPTFMVTMLPRSGSNVILESLNELALGTGR